MRERERRTSKKEEMKGKQKWKVKRGATDQSINDIMRKRVGDKEARDEQRDRDTHKPSSANEKEQQLTLPVEQADQDKQEKEREGDIE